MKGVRIAGKSLTLNAGYLKGEKRMGIWQTEEELEEMPELIEKEMPFFEEGKKIYQDMLRDLPAYEAIKKKQLKLFSKLCPNRCGQIDFEKNTVKYDEEKYTEWLCNFSLSEIEDLIRIFEITSLDYEVRISDLYDISDTFSVYYANTEKDIYRYKVAIELHSLYINHYRKLLEKTGIYKWDMCEYKYSCPWTGCEKEIAPDKYSDSNLLLSDSEVIAIMRSLYSEACAKVDAPPIEDFKFGFTDLNSKKRRCTARLDKEHLEECRKRGFQLLNININAEQFQQEYVVKVEDGREVYYFEFEVDVEN